MSACATFTVRPTRAPRTPVVERVDDTDQLWVHFTAHPSPEVCDKLIVRYAPLVKYVAGRVGVGLPRNVEQADLASYGTFGLIDAIEQVDPERGFAFETYAIARIKGPSSMGSRSQRSAGFSASWRIACVRSTPRPSCS